MEVLVKSLNVGLGLKSKSVWVALVEGVFLDSFVFFARVLRFSGWGVFFSKFCSRCGKVDTIITFQRYALDWGVYVLCFVRADGSVRYPSLFFYLFLHTFCLVYWFRFL